MRTRVPSPGPLSMLTCPPDCLAKPKIIESPRPEPCPMPFVVKKGSKAWLKIYPGSPWENGYNERFNGTLRREVLNAEWFATTELAQIAINGWLREYNHTRPHQALKMRQPVPETPRRNGPAMGG